MSNDLYVFLCYNLGFGIRAPCVLVIIMTHELSNKHQIKRLQPLSYLIIASNKIPEKTLTMGQFILRSIYAAPCAPPGQDCPMRGCVRSATSNKGPSVCALPNSQKLRLYDWLNSKLTLAPNDPALPN